MAQDEDTPMCMPTHYRKRGSLTPNLCVEIVLALSLPLALMISGVTRVQATELHPGSGDEEMAQGKELMTQGSFAQSAVHWMEAARLYEQAGNIHRQSRALTYLAYAFQQEGQARNAIATLQVALQLSEKAGDRPQTAVILGQLGTATFALGQKETAVEHLKKALSLAREAKKPALEATLLNDLGNALPPSQRRIEDVDIYAHSRMLASQTAQPELALTARINTAIAFIENGRAGEAQKELDQAFKEARLLSDSHAKANGYLNIGLGYHDLLPVSKVSPTARPPAPITSSGRSSPRPLSASSLSPSQKRLAQKAQDAFFHAANIAARLGDARAEAYARGYVGAVLEKEGRYEEALTWTREAVFMAQKVNATDSLYQWNWQSARLLKATGNMDGALSAYQRAMAIFKPISQEVARGYQSRRRSFRESIAPLFVEFEDILLRRAKESQNVEETQQLLVQVRNVAESSRMAELEDYYRDECVTNARVARVGSSTVPAHTAVIYPIMLPDRLELLMQTAGTLQRVEVKDKVNAEQLTQQANDFRAGLTDPNSSYFYDVATTLYDWLLRPIEAELAAHAVHTVVFVPDGPLRAIPIAALHDGKQFAFEKYAIAVTPSMELTDTRSVDLSKATILSLGLTESRGGFPALPNVATEIASLEHLYGGKHMLDGQFQIPSVEPELKGREVSIMHFATHGEMGNEASQSFLLAYDDKISMNHLSDLVGFLRHRLAPLELLTLSACETAAGDDRAALGLAGVAVKAGARSALATLWPVNDKATSELVIEFYRLLRQESLSKAEALRRAQLKIKHTPGYEHPLFWAPFLLIGNWR